MYYQKLRITSDGKLETVSHSNITISCLGERRLVRLYPELILMLSSCYYNLKAITSDFSELPPQKINPPYKLYRNYHHYFVRKKIQKTAFKWMDRKSKARTQDGNYNQQIFAHQQHIRLLKEKFQPQSQSSQVNTSTNKKFQYSQTEGFLKIILGEKYVEKDIETNIKMFFREHHDPAYQEKFNSPDFSFDKFDTGFKNQIKEIIEAETQSEDYVFYHGLIEEMGCYSNLAFISYDL